MATAMIRGRNPRSRRLRGRHESGDEHVVLDYSKAPEENAKECLINISKPGVSRSKKLCYFNAFVRLCYRYGSQIEKTGLSKEETLCCLRMGLIHEAKELRAACLRALRYYIHDTESLDALLRLHIDYLIARSLDIVLDNEIERVQAMRLIRKILQVCPEKFPCSLLNVMVSIANNGVQEHDRLVRTSLATICELAFYHPKLVAQHGCISSLLKNVLECHSLARINESLLVTVLFLLNHPRSRCYIKEDLDLEQLLAPFTDCHYKFTNESGSDTLSEDRENRFEASKMAISTIIKSWPGIIRLCRPDGSGIQSLIGVLYLPTMETRKEVMDILFDVFRLPLPDWTISFPHALLSVDPSEMRDSWKLSEGFVAEEGKAILQHLAKTRPNLVDNHLALILSAFVSAGLLEALVEVITSGDEYTSVRATILLGELLHMANTILPYECGHHSHCLPTLMEQATSFQLSGKERNRACMAVNCLNRLHALKKRGPVSCSLFLAQIEYNCHQEDQIKHRPLHLSTDTLQQCFEKKKLKKKKVPTATLR